MTIRTALWRTTARCAALLAPALVVAAAFPANATSTGFSDLSLASYWAPAWYQDTDSSNYKADYMSRFNYDGDWKGNNNWENLGSYSVKGEAYYAVIETQSHFFLVYADFHPRDWSESCLLGDCHENDMEGVLVAVKKDGTTYGKFQAMVTVAHKDFWSYKDYQSALSNAVTNTGQTIDGDVQFYNATHPFVYIEAKGHGDYGSKRWETGGFPGGDGVIYYNGSVAEQPSSGNDRVVGYTLRSMNELWTRRNEYVETFASFGTFRGDTYGTNSANAPWGWDDQDDGAVYRGDLYMAPALLCATYHGGWGTMSQTYIYSSDGAAR
jgi:hypothetical protein